MNKIDCNVHLCDFCGACVAVCPQDAIDLAEASWTLMDHRCTLCTKCIDICPVQALAAANEI